MSKYFSWGIEDGVAETGKITLPIVKSDKNVLFEGMKGVISQEHDTAISGVCLFGADWCVKFTSGAIRSVALPLERARVESRITQGGVVEKIFFPINLTAYHTKLIDFVADTVVQTDPRMILFHIPTEEYKQYINDLSTLMQKSIPGAFDILEAFVVKVKQYFIQAMKKIGFKNYHFIEPMKCGAKNPEESYCLPYVHPEIFGAQKGSIYAIEDLVEIKIALEVEKVYGYCVPVKYCVLDIPHPYAIFDKKKLETDAYVVIAPV